uniref:Uncharacterized protein n=1 Tax=Tanacetum cinerariifolium TaxID=118510 RepID=A0A6L2JN41_TANCI|nr:hypothetical protein [Tanacetum cinerariifolium]
MKKFSQTLDTALYLMRRSLEVLRKFHMTIFGGRFNHLLHVSSPLLSKPRVAIRITCSLLRSQTISLLNNLLKSPKQQPPQSKTKIINKKPKQSEEKVDVEVVLQRLMKLEKKVKAMSKIDHIEAIDKSLQAHLKNVFPKAIPDFVDDDDIDKRYNVQPTQKKRCHDDQDPLEDEDNDMTKKRRKDTNTSSSKKDVVMDAEQPPQDDAALNQDKSKWFKQDVVERPETLDLEWFKEPNVNDNPEQNWFNEMVNAEKDPKKFDDLIRSTIDFTKLSKNCLQKDKLTKADIEGPALAILKGNFKNNVELEYNL